MLSEISHRRVSIRSITIGNLIKLYRDGILAIPEFQRDYVWKPSKAPKLLDSLWNRFPIGSLLTWSTNDDVQSRVRTRVTSPTQWIIDGQQRTRTLVKIMDCEIPVLFDLKREHFLLENAATRNSQEPTLIPVSDIWGRNLMELTRRIDGAARNSKEEKLFEQRLQACRDLLNLEIPQIHLEGHTIGDAIQAFQRINTQGIRLKSTDIEIAQLTVRHSGFVKNAVQPYIDTLKTRGWERVYLSQIFLACESIAERGRRGDQRKRLHDLDKSELNAAWKQLTKGLDEAIELLDDELGIKDMSIFPSGALLMPLAVLLSGAFRSRPKTRDMVGWMVAASITKRYSGSPQQKLDRDLAACFESNPIKALHRNNKKDAGRAQVTANQRNFESALHDRYAMFLTYLACRLSGMRDLFDGRRVSSSSVEWHHIIPRASIRPDKRRVLDNSANIAFIIAPTNRNISNSKAEDYLSKTDPEFLDSQCIPLGPELWRDPKRFMRKRAQIMAKVIKEYLNLK